MDDLYRELILEHSQHPHNHGEIPGADISYEDSNPLCGDKIRIDIKLRGDVIEDVKFNGKGCAISQASASMLTDPIGSIWKATFSDFGICISQAAQDQMPEVPRGCKPVS